MLVVGARDVEAGAVSVRLHQGKPQGLKPKAEMIANIQAATRAPFAAFILPDDVYPLAMIRVSTSVFRPPRRLVVVSPEPPFSKSNHICGAVPAGPLAPGEEGDLGKLVMDLSPIGIPTTSRTFLLRVDGDSMTGAGINDGDYVILEQRSHKPGDIVSALVENEVTLKRYVIEHDRPLLRAENPKYGDIPLTEGSLVQGVVVGLIRKM